MSYAAIFALSTLATVVIVAAVLSRLERRERAQSEGRERPPCVKDCVICAKLTRKAMKTTLLLIGVSVVVMLGAVAARAQIYGQVLTFRPMGFVEDGINVTPLDKKDLVPREQIMEQITKLQEDLKAAQDTFEVKYGAVPPSGCAPYAIVEERGEFVITTKYKPTKDCNPLAMRGVQYN
jgi:hypothetical protein